MFIKYCQLLVLLCYIYLFLASAIPSSKLFGVPINNILFLLVNIVFLNILLFKPRIRVQCAELIISLFYLIMIIILYYVYGVLYHQDIASATAELLALLSTIAPLLVFAYIINFDINYFRNICYILLLGNSFYCLTKILFIFISIYSNDNITSIYNSVFGIKELVGGDIGGDFSVFFIRIISNNDILTIFLLGLMILAKSQQLIINNYLKSIIVPLFILSLIISFSRYIYIMMLLLLIIYAFISSKRLIIILCLTLCLLFYIMYNTELTNAIFMRFNTDYVSSSDDLRIKQNYYLIKEWKENLFFGKGLGAYAKDFLRSDQKYLYESQLLSFVLKYGLIGIMLILPLLLYPIRIMLRYIPNREALIIISLYILFLLGSNTNPYLLSTASGCIFVLFMIMQFRYDTLMICRKNYG